MNSSKTELTRPERDRLVGALLTFALDEIHAQVGDPEFALLVVLQRNGA